MDDLVCNVAVDVEVCNVATDVEILFAEDVSFLNMAKTGRLLQKTPKHLGKMLLNGSTAMI